MYAEAAALNGTLVTNLAQSYLNVQPETSMSRFNPHFPNAPQVFDAAEKFKQRCLVGQGSLFLDDEHLWTEERFQSLIDAYVKEGLHNLRRSAS